MSDKWEIYDRLIEGIPEDVVVDDYGIGCVWTFVQAGKGKGLVLTVHQRAGEETEIKPLIGRPLKEAAKLVKSWNFMEATIGMAAINAWYNSEEKAEAKGLLDPELQGNDKGDVFRVFGEDVRGKKVAVIGHFPYLERKLAPICQLSILERDPMEGDYPDSACEYILDDQDYVFITGMTLTNKTLPRLLELCANAKVCMVGPSAPLSDILFDYNVYCISGFCAIDHEKISEILRRGGRQEVFKGGQMVNYYNPRVKREAQEAENIRG